MMFSMTQTTVVTTRIKKEIKETLEKAGINIPKDHQATPRRTRMENSTERRNRKTKITLGQS